MEGVNKELLEELLYDKTRKEVLEILDNVDVAETLHIYMNNYNWDNGFDIPRKVVQKECCELSTALMIFYLADGERYLENKKDVEQSNLREWSLFLQEVYKKIIRGDFKKGNIAFKPPLNKVAIYKLKKNIMPEEYIFLEEIDGNQIDKIV